MNIVITGANGFIGKNLAIRLSESGYTNVSSITRETSDSDFHETLASADCVFHLAGVNRPQNDHDFIVGNADLTRMLCKVLAATGRRATVILASSSRAEQESAYGRSKLAAERAVLDYGASTGARIHIFRLTNVFGKWARPNYNSAVATFCHNVSRGLPIVVNDPAAPLHLVHVDDVILAFVKCLPVLPLVDTVVPSQSRSPASTENASVYTEVDHIYSTTVGDVVDVLRGFAESRTSRTVGRVGTGLMRALYGTYMSYVPANNFAYEIPRHEGLRGCFCEILRTPDCGQFSYFTAQPGATRGEDYHHLKSEKLLVIKGTARYRFRNIDTAETHEFLVRGADATVVDIAPGWAHSITNVGDDELFVMLWANEVFER